MLLLKEMERELHRLNMEGACGRGGGDVRPGEQEQNPLTSDPTSTEGEKPRRRGRSGVHHGF